MNQWIAAFINSFSVRYELSRPQVRKRVAHRGILLPDSEQLGHIILENTSHLSLEKLHFSESAFGIYLDNYDLNNIQIKDSHFVDNRVGLSAFSIFAAHRDIHFVDNFLQGNDWGVSTGTLGDTGWRIENNTLKNNGTSLRLGFDQGVAANNQIIGSEFYGIDANIIEGEIFGNVVVNSGIDGIAANLEMGAIYDNDVSISGQHGIEVDGDQNAPNIVIVSGNRVHENEGVGILAEYATVNKNVVHSNLVGIQSYGRVEFNRVFNNAEDGIRGRRSINGNHVYSNGWAGITADSNPTFDTFFIKNNIVYDNGTAGISTNAPYVVVISNNTIYQTSGVGLEFSGLEGHVFNNVFWVEGASAISTPGTVFRMTLDANQYHVGTSTTDNTFTAIAQGNTYDLFSDWQNAFPFDSNSYNSEPQFVDPNGADDVLGYSARGDFDGGEDDNFELRAGALAIDRANEYYQPETDQLGRERIDDLAIANQGKRLTEDTLNTSLFSDNGASQGWSADANVWRYNFQNGFRFEFYDRIYSSVFVTTEGYLHFGRLVDALDETNSTEDLIQFPRITPLWENLSTAAPGYDIFVDASEPNQVEFRWQALNEDTMTDVNFSVTLFASGNIRFDYGSGNSNLTPTIGISAGDQVSYALATYDGQSNLGSANSLLYDLKTDGFVDVGALEFSGSSDDATPPTILSSSPGFVHDGGSGNGFEELMIEFNETINSFDANSAASYILQNAGQNGVLGDADDEFLNIEPSHELGSQVIYLNAQGGELTAQLYRLTIASRSSGGIHDLAGNALDGDEDGVELGNYVRDFVVSSLPVEIPVDSINVLRGEISSGTVGNVRVSDNVDLSLRHNQSSIQSVVELETFGVSHTLAPTHFEFTLESSVFARGDVTQTIWLWNYQTSDYEQIDQRSASRFGDQIVSVVPEGDLSRFVQPGTGNLRSKIQFQSFNNRWILSANIDQVIWAISE